jgi:hypothetical protein
MLKCINPVSLRHYAGCCHAMMATQRRSHVSVATDADAGSSTLKMTWRLSSLQYTGRDTCTCVGGKKAGGLSRHARGTTPPCAACS